MTTSNSLRVLMKLFRLFQMVFIATLAANAASEQGLKTASETNLVAKPQDPALVEVADVPGLPRVLLIGDSISMGYTLPVREKLKGRANIHHPPENCGDTARGLSHLSSWLGEGQWDVIHFNFGLHDLKYLDEQGNYVPSDRGKQVAPPKVYRQQLNALTLRLKATGAKLVFATTTPVPAGTQGRVMGDEIIYNKVALEVMKKLNVHIDDLYAFVLEQQKKLPPHSLSELTTPTKQVELRPGEIQLPFNVHFTPEGYEKLANIVVASIENKLPAGR